MLIFLRLARGNFIVLNELGQFCNMLTLLVYDSCFSSYPGILWLN